MLSSSTIGHEKVEIDCYKSIFSLDKKTRKACLSLISKYSYRSSNYRNYGFDPFISQLVYEDAVRKVHKRFENEDRVEYLVTKNLMLGTLKVIHARYNRPLCAKEESTLEHRIKQRALNIVYLWIRSKNIFMPREWRTSPEGKIAEDFRNYVYSMIWRDKP
jgi:hypothetical protein